MQDLKQIESRISQLNQEAANAFLEIGKLLGQARPSFSSAKDFLEWALAKFGYKKAFTYRLMQVAESFSEKPEFNGVAIRVLGIVAGLPEEQQKEASKLAEAGELDTKSAKELQEAAKESISDFEPAPIELQEPAEPASNASETETEIKLRLLIKELQEELNQLKAKPKAKQELPCLPQFRQQDLALRLGLTSTQSKDKKAVNEAFRAWVKLGYGKMHPSFSKLEEAKEALLSLI